MRLRLRGRDLGFPDCRRWRDAKSTAHRKVEDHAAHDWYEAEVAFGDDESCGRAFDWASKEVLAYRIFPPSVLRAKVCTSSGLLRMGAIIVQHVPLGPFFLEAAVRVVQVTKPDSGGIRMGFRYATLEGHPERGVAEFIVEQRTGPSRVAFSIESWSEAGHWTTRLSRPLARWMQKRASRHALAWMVNRLHGSGRQS